MSARTPLLRTGLLCCLLLVGCNSVTGKVDGVTIHAASSFFVQEADAFGDESPDDLVTVFVSTMASSCRTVEDLADALTESDDAEEASDAWRSIARKKFWELRIFVRTSDVDLALGDTTVAGLTWDRDLTERDQTYASIYRYKDWLDEGYWETEEDPANVYRDYWYSDEGELEIGSHTPGDRITGSFTTTAADPETGDEAGDITISFDAYRCVGAERELY
jgi:hypothetical protein